MELSGGEGRPGLKWVTVAGAVTAPGTFQVPLGVSIAEMLNWPVIRFLKICGH